MIHHRFMEVTYYVCLRLYIYKYIYIANYILLIFDILIDYHAEIYPSDGINTKIGNFVPVLTRNSILLYCYIILTGCDVIDCDVMFI